MFDPDGRLHVHGSGEIWRYRVRCRCCFARRQRARWNGNSGSRILDHVLLLVDTILPDRLPHIGRLKALKEPPVPPTDHRRCRLAFPVDRPGERNARPKVSMIADTILPLIANAITQGKVRTQPPIILEEEPGVKQHRTRGGCSDRYLVLRWLAGGIAIERCIRIFSVEARS